MLPLPFPFGLFPDFANNFSHFDIFAFGVFAFVFGVFVLAFGVFVSRAFVLL